MKRVGFLALVAGLGILLSGDPASASIVDNQFDQQVTGEMIWGSGNSNGGFTTDRHNGIELALRAKVRYPSPSDTPANIKSQGNGTYGKIGDSFAPTGHVSNGSSPGPRASWNVDWSINSNFDGSTGAVLSDYIYALERDYDPGYGANEFSQPAYFVSDLINDAFDTTLNLYADHQFGNNGTPQGAGVKATSAGDYASLIGANNLAQNSTNLAFEDIGGLLDPTASGLYTFRLSAYDRNSGALLAQTQINVLVGDGVVPEATALLTWSGLIGCIALIRRRHNG